MKNELLVFKMFIWEKQTKKDFNKKNLSFHLQWIWLEKSVIPLSDLPSN